MAKLHRAPNRVAPAERSPYPPLAQLTVSLWMRKNFPRSFRILITCRLPVVGTSRQVARSSVTSSTAPVSGIPFDFDLGRWIGNLGRRRGTGWGLDVHAPFAGAIHRDFERTNLNRHSGLRDPARDLGRTDREATSGGRIALHRDRRAAAQGFHLILHHRAAFVVAPHRLVGGHSNVTAPAGLGSMTVRTMIVVPTFPRLSSVDNVTSWVPAPTRLPGAGSWETTGFPGNPQLSRSVTNGRRSGTRTLQGTSMAGWPIRTVTWLVVVMRRGGVVSPKNKQDGQP